MRKILLVVDFQKDFVDGTLGFEKAVALDIKIAQRLKKAKENAMIFILDPMLATGGSMCSAIDEAKKTGIKKI